MISDKNKHATVSWYLHYVNLRFLSGSYIQTNAEKTGGVNKIYNLKFVNGELNEINMYNNNGLKNNICAEIFTFKAILPNIK